MNPTIAVLIYSSSAAAVASLGALPLIGRTHIPRRWLGWANALAAGFMFGAAYALMTAGLAGALLAGGLGAVLGIGFVHSTHAAAGTEDLDLNRLDATSEAYGYQVLLINTLHSAAEGIAIGAAMILGLPFGIFLAAAIATHNIPEATILCAVLHSRGVRLASAAGLAVATNVTQILLAVATFAIVSAAPAALPWALGFAVGALWHLVLVELLPESYREAGHTSIAAVVAVAMGVVIFLHGIV